MDFIFTWIWADPNCRIIETLPEACLRIGMMLQSSRLVRTAFSVLVSEEALKISTEYHFKDIRDIERQAYGYSPGKTRFGRIRDPIDEDAMNIIQHAGQQFSTRVDSLVTKLYHHLAEWLQDLPSYRKILNKAEFNARHGEKGQEAVRKLENQLVHYVRGRLIWALVARLEPQQAKRAREHRLMEGYKQPPERDFNVIYNSLKGKERTMTRFFWEIIRDLGWGVCYPCNLFLDYDSIISYDMHMRALEPYGVRKVSTDTLIDLVKEFNQQVYDDIKTKKYNDGIYPPEAFDPVDHKDVNTPTQELDEWSIAPDLNPSSWFNPFNPFNPESLNAPPTHLSAIAGSSSSKTKHAAKIEAPAPTLRALGTLSIPKDENIDECSVFFSLKGFFQEVSKHLQDICGTMLSYGENDWSTTCDTLLCLTDEEYKFLPLYADGLNDGSGGVFEDAIPAAEKGPSGPGPSFHTGSTMGSRASSLAEWDGMSDVATETAGLDSSLGVEDGFSDDHIDRRLVKAEEDFPSAEFNLPIRGKDGDKVKKPESDLMNDEFLYEEEEEDEDDFSLIDAEDGNTTE